MFSLCQIRADSAQRADHGGAGSDCIILRVFCFSCVFPSLVFRLFPQTSVTILVVLASQTTSVSTRVSVCEPDSEHMVEMSDVGHKLLHLKPIFQNCTSKTANSLLCVIKWQPSERKKTTEMFSQHNCHNSSRMTRFGLKLLGEKVSVGF